MIRTIIPQPKISLNNKNRKNRDLLLVIYSLLCLLKISVTYTFLSSLSLSHCVLSFSLSLLTCYYRKGSLAVHPGTGNIQGIPEMNLKNDICIFFHFFYRLFLCQSKTRTVRRPAQNCIKYNDQQVRSK